MTHVGGVLISFALILLWPSDVCAGDDAPDWSLAQRDVTAALAQAGNSLAALVKQVSQSTPTNSQTAMFRLAVFTRAGVSTESIQALRDIKRFCPDLDNSQVSSIYYDACDHLQAWDVAQAVVEVFADNIFDLTLDNRLLEHLSSSGWTFDRVDQWLAAKPKGIKNFWIKQRLHFNRQQGRGETLEKELEDRLRASPKDAAEVISFLDVIASAGYERREAPDLEWIAEITQPKLASDAADIAGRLALLKSWKAAAVFYRQAMATPFTDAEAMRLGLMCQAFMPAAIVRARFEADTREGLAACLLKMGQAGEAQKWMQEASEIREKNHLGRNALFTGLVQGASGQRVIEGQIQAEEQASGDDPKYWHERELFESYLDTGDWKRAETIFPDAARRLTTKELPEWYSRIAVMAAKAGAKTDAMRIWSRVANLDLSATGALDQLVKAGLRNELIDFYREMQQAIPSSDIPAKALKTWRAQDSKQVP